MEIIVFRPWAFVFLITAILFCFFRLRAIKAWMGIIDAHLIEPLLMRVSLHLKGMLSAVFLFLVSCCVVFALAGVSVTKNDRPLYQPKTPAVIVLDMSLSMKVKDVTPNRFSRAVFKTYDLLAALEGVPTAFIVFTDEPYQLAPTTTEKGVIEGILPLLNFNLIPSQGSRMDRAVREALQTIKDSGADYGDIFLLTDGGEDVLEIQDQTMALIRSAAKRGNRLFVLGTGTPKGAALFEKEDVPVFDRLGNPVYHRLKTAYLEKLAADGNGAYAQISADGSDIAALIKAREKVMAVGDKSDLRDRENRADEGYWFLILPLLVFPFLFRQGRFLVLFLMFILPCEVFAAPVDLFLNPPALAMKRLSEGDPDQAVALALKADSFTAFYNVGTQMILLKNYPKAIELLEKAVLKRPDNEDAQINLEIARRLNENPPPPETDQENKNDNTQNPDQSGGKGGESEGENNLNQNNNNDQQQSDKQENNDQNDSPENQSGNGGSEDQNENGSGGSGGDGSEEQEEQGQESPADADEGNGGEKPQAGPDSDNNDENKEITPVREDPSALLRHKIMFLYREERYASDKQMGAEW